MKYINKLKLKFALALQPYYEDLIRQITGESFSEKYLRVFISESVETYGTAQTIKALLNSSIIKDSVQLGTTLIDSVDELDLQLALLRGAILYKDNDNEYLTYAREQIANRNIEELIQAISSNGIFKKMLVENYVRNYDLTAKKIFEKQDTDRETIRGLVLLDEYKKQRETKDKKDEKKLKKGNQE